MSENKKSHKWKILISIVVFLTIVVFLLFSPKIFNSASNNILGLIFGSGQQNENYEPEKEKENIRTIIVDFYDTYQKLDSEKLVSLTNGPLSLWEKNHISVIKEQDQGYNQAIISLSNLNFEFKNYNANDTEISVTRLNILETPMPFKFGETTQGIMKFKLKKENSWKIVDRTYNSLWVSEVY